jgi:hypothetical protein
MTDQNPLRNESGTASSAPAWLLVPLLRAASFFAAAVPASAAETVHAQFKEEYRAFLRDYCVDCHGAEKQKGKVRLDQVSFTLDSVQGADLWQKILNQVNSGEMPPDESKQPERSAKTEFLDALSHTLMAARRTLGDSGGKITMRRLNRREYKNTIRDLLGVNIDVRDLPADGGAGTFDTAGASLFMSSDQIEQYLLLGRRALDEHFARTQPWAVQTGTEARTYRQRREVELHANAMVGGTYNGYYKEGHRVAKAYLDSDRSQPPSAFGKGIPDEVEARFRVKVFEEHGPSFERYLNDPLAKTGSLLTIFNVHTEEVITLPPDQPSGWLKTKHEVETAPPGEYILRIRTGALEGAPSERRFLMFGSRKEKDDFSLLQTFQISGTTDSPQTLEVPVSITADGPHTFVLREKRDPKLDHQAYTEARKATGVGPASALWVDWVEWEGPFYRQSGGGPQAVLTASTRDGSGAREVLEKFALRAFRGEAPGKEYLTKLERLFEARIQAGDDFQTALKEPLSVILATPRFLYLSEPSSEQTPRPLTAWELATRLSYFLWSAPPDDTLLALARSGELQKPEVLKAQVDRLTASDKLREFVAGFTHQWLRMDRLDFFQFNTQLYRDFDESTKAAARSEVFRTIEHLLRTNSSARDLLKSDYVVINGLLASFYGLEGVSGDEFRKVTLPAGSPRGGLLGMSAVLAMGSNGEHTSPVERGAWVLRFLLNEPPPNAPPNVPQITRLNGQLLTTRERLLAHQEEPQCASCHRAIDPIGFGLENFNTVGKWRTEDSFQAVDANGKPNPRQVKHWTIDPSAAFHKGPAFKDYFELRDIIASRPEAFARGLAENLIAYALGRPFGFTDEDLASGIVQSAKTKDFALREFVQALVASKQFQTK